MADFPAPQSVPGSPTAAVERRPSGLRAVRHRGGSRNRRPGPGVAVSADDHSGIIGVIVCYVKRDEARNTWVASHLTWLIRTFWWSFLWDMLGLLILIMFGLILIGIPIAFGIWLVTAIWVIYRVVRGYLLFKDSKPIPGI